ncbi:MAG: glycine--tRNA ligase [Planctomycetota bacterium]|nr:glycine--tRNA ligase [Planctomycetota bacterium]
MDDLVALCKRCGFVFPASEIYGGINGFWDFGPRGVALKNNLRDAWWRDMVECPPIGPDGEPLSIVGLDSAIIQNPKVWEASGHIGGFNDPMVDCTESKKRYRADQIRVLISWDVEADSGDDSHPAIQRLYAFIEDDESSYKSAIKKTTKYAKAIGVSVVDNPEHWSFSHPEFADARQYIVGPDVETPGTLTEPRMFNLMFETYIGAIRDEDNKSYLRPETAQGIFTNYKNVLDTMRVKLPFGIAQVGKSFRNEVTPRNFIFRSREFEQMEMEWFCPPDQSQVWYEFWVEQRTNWWKSVGLTGDNLIRRDHDADELAHYSTACADVEYRYPFTSPGYGELEGIAHRGCFDLDAHQKASKTKLEYFDQDLQVKLQKEGVDKEEIKQRSKYMPHVIEPAAGLTRGVLALLCEAYTPDPERPSGVVMKFNPAMAPIKAGIFPLVNKDGMPEVAQKLYQELRTKYACQYDGKQSIGKRYARMDEAGAPYSFTIDGDTLTDQTVTVRDRDTASQERIALDQVSTFLADRID